MSASKSPLKLKALLRKLGIKQSEFARRCGIRYTTFCNLLNYGKSACNDLVWARQSAAIAAQLAAAGASANAISTALLPRMPAAKPATKQAAHAAQALRVVPAGGVPAKPEKAVDVSQPTPSVKETDMLLNRQTLTAEAKAHFGLAANPFVNDIQSHSDVYLTPEARYVREVLWQHAKHGGMLAIVGESGSGKTVLVSEFRDRVRRDGRDVLIIEPSTLYSEPSDNLGKTLKSAAIIEAILSTVAPSTAIKSSAQGRARQLEQILVAGHRAGQRYVLVIEEAHCLPTPTLKHLKRFAELRDGLYPLLSIVLVAQPELRARLSVNNADIREVAQRCDFVELPPLDKHLGDYLAFKLKRVGADATRLVTPEAVKAMAERLTFAPRRSAAKPGAQVVGAAVSLCYPLAVANVLTAALNAAAELGADVVDADIVREAA